MKKVIIFGLIAVISAFLVPSVSKVIEPVKSDFTLQKKAETLHSTVCEVSSPGIFFPARISNLTDNYDIEGHLVLTFIGDKERANALNLRPHKPDPFSLHSQHSDKLYNYIRKISSNKITDTLYPPKEYLV